MVTCTILCWGGWLLVLFLVNPESTNFLGFFLFYASLFFALVGTLALMSYFLRFIFTRRYTKAEGVQISFRQAIFFSIVITGSFFLQANKLLSWFNTILLVALVTFVEFLIISLKRDTGGQPDGIKPSAEQQVK